MCVEDKYAKTIAVVYPAVAPSDDYFLPIDKEIRSHVTISILGEVSEIDFTKEELLLILRSIEWEEITEAEVEKLELFGIRNDFLVMLVNAPALQNNWKRVNEALTGAGIVSVDKYPTYRPHITLKENYDGFVPPAEYLPDTVKLGAPFLWWGTEAIQL